MRRELVTGCTSGGCDQFDTSPESSKNCDLHFANVHRLKTNYSVDVRERETSLFATRWVGFKHLQYIQYKYNKIPTIW